MDTTLIATYSNEKDAQVTINLLSEHGFDSEKVSIVMQDKSKQEETEDNFSSTDLTVDEMMNETEDENYDLDEEDFEEPTGLIDPIPSINLGENNIDSFGDGDFMLGGPILEKIDEDEVGASEEIMLTEVLMAFGITDEELIAYENRIKSGEVLVSIIVDTDDLDEYREVLGAGEPTTLEVLELEEE